VTDGIGKDPLAVTSMQTRRCRPDLQARATTPR
jgi:hypothetical protein